MKKIYKIAKSMTMSSEKEILYKTNSYFMYCIMFWWYQKKYKNWFIWGKRTIRREKKQ